MTLKQRKPGGPWWIDFKAPKQPRVRVSTGTTDRALAELAHKKLEVEAFEGKFFDKAKHLPLAAAFKQAMREHWKNTKDAAKVQARWDTHIAPVLPIDQLGLADLKRSHLVIVKQVAECKKLAPATINRILAVLSKLATLGVEWEIREVAIRAPKLDEPPGRTRVATPEELELAFDYYAERANLPMIQLIEFLVDTGCRLSEPLGLLSKDCDWSSNQFKLRDTKTGDDVWKPMTRRVQAILLGRADNVRVFHDLYTTKVENEWRAMRKAIGLEGDEEFVIHCLRHTTATRLDAADVPTRHIQQYLGHKSYQTTLRYIHGNRKVLARAALTLESATGVTQGTRSLPRPIEGVELEQLSDVHRNQLDSFARAPASHRPGGEIGRHKGLKIREEPK